MSDELFASISKLAEIFVLMGGGAVAREAWGWFRGRKKESAEIKQIDQTMINTTLELTDDIIRDWMTLANKSAKEVLIVRRYASRLENFMEISLRLLKDASDMLKSGVIQRGEKFSQDTELLREQVFKEMSDQSRIDAATRDPETTKS